MITAFIYTLFCCGFLLGTDDGEKWKLADYLIFYLAPITAPITLGGCIGKFFRDYFDKINREKNNK